MKRTIVFTTFALATAIALITAAAAGGNRGRGGGDDGKRKQLATAAVTVFPLRLVPKQEVPPIRDLRARADGNVTFDVTRDSGSAITSGEVVFYFNYDFSHAVTITGLHIHQGQRGTNGPIVVDSGTAAFTDADGDGNVTTVVTGVSPATLQAILTSPKGYYANLHTSVYPGGAIRDQLKHAKRFKNKNDDDSDDTDD